MSNDLVVWDDKKLQEIKKLYAPNLTNDEFQIFAGIGKMTGLNPFLREIWAVKYGNAPASIFIGRDGYRKAAQASPLYDWHSVEDVRENDIFHIKNGEIIHEINMKDRWKLVGSYALAQRKGASRPNYVRVDLSEYNTGKSVWASKPSTMIKKVAEAQVLRMTFQDLFAGTYDEAEEWEQKDEAKKQKEPPRKVIDMTPEDEITDEVEKDIEDAYIAFSDRISKSTSSDELKDIWEEIKIQKNFLGKDFLSDLTDRIKSAKKSLDAIPETPVEEPEYLEEEAENMIDSDNVDDEEIVDIPTVKMQIIFIEKIQATTTREELNQVVLEIDTALAEKKITLEQYGIINSHKWIRMNKFPKA